MRVAYITTDDMSPMGVGRVTRMSTEGAERDDCIRSAYKNPVSAEGGGVGRISSFCYDDSLGNTKDNRFWKMIEEVAASAKSADPKMMVLTTDEYGNELAYVEKWNEPGVVKEVLQAKYAQFIPLHKPPFTAERFRPLCILCDEEASLKPHIKINAMASRLFGPQVFGGVLRGVVVVAPAE